jgi:hypothetical protein
LYLFLSECEAEVVRSGGIPLGVKAGATKKKKKKKTVDSEDVEGAVVQEAIIGKGMLLVATY